MNEQNIGIAVEGGGVRSLIFSLGFMHGLFRLGIFQNCNYISSVSGGSWATIPLCYSKQDDYKLEELFGHLHDPELLNHNQIENIDDNAIIKQICAFHYSIYPKLLLKSIINSICYCFPKQYNQGKFVNFWNNSIGKILLQKYQLYNDNILPSIAINTQTENPLHLQQSQQFQHYQQSQLQMQQQMQQKGIEFRPIRNDCPYLIVNGSVLINKEIVQQVEFCPDYYQINGYEKIEPIYFCKNYSSNNNNNNNNCNYTKEEGYDVKLTTTIRNKQPSKTPEIISILGFFGITSNVFLYFYNIFKFCRLSYLQSNSTLPTHKQNTFLFGDGYFIDNTAILALLKRNVRNVISIINVPNLNHISSEIDLKTLANLFSDNPVKTIHGINSPSVKVFATEEWCRFLRLLEQKKSSNEPLIFNMRLDVLENTYHGIKGGYNVSILFMISSISQEWMSIINRDIHAKVKDVLDDEKNYNIGKIVYSELEANILYQMTTFDVINCGTEIINAFNKN
jgi:hypothetical protein